jgi:ligand-binding sensor domain-containing protein
VLVGAGLLGNTCVSYALDPSRALTQYTHTAWRVQSGELPAQVTSIAQSKDGYIWLASTIEGKLVCVRDGAAIPIQAEASGTASVRGRFQQLCGPGKSVAYEETTHLTEAEQAVYAQVKARCVVLEQEKLPHEFLVAALRAVCEVDS